MANTYTQLYLHIVFAVKGRANLISKNWKEKLFQYITGIVTNKNQKLMIINGMPDHLHILVGLKPDCALSVQRSTPSGSHPILHPFSINVQSLRDS
jgi:REP element-mobilizing transposase RayT